MRRLLLTLAATLAVAAPLASLDVAWAKDGQGRGNGGDWQQRGGGDHGDRGGGNHGDRGGGNWRGDGPGRGNGNGGGNGNGNGGGRWREAPPRDYPMPQRMPAPSPRRGGYLPPEASGGAIQDNARYRLRAPPRGYTWVRIGNDFALVSEATGQVFDVVPGR